MLYLQLFCDFYANKYYFFLKMLRLLSKSIIFLHIWKEVEKFLS